MLFSRLFCLRRALRRIRPKPKRKSRILVHADHPKRHVTKKHGNKYPTKNFKRFVIHKDARKNEPRAPDTTTLLQDNSYFDGTLPEDSRKRQAVLLECYTEESPLYHEMNQALRADDARGLEYFGAYIKELQDVFLTGRHAKIVTPYTGKVYRGIQVDDPNEALKQYRPGHTFVWESFTSTSQERHAAEGFGGGIIFEIFCRPPHEHEYAPASIARFSETPEECEVLFPPFVQFRVIKVRTVETPIVVCETVGYHRA